MRYLKRTLLLTVMLSSLTTYVNAADITLTGALISYHAQEGYYTGSVTNTTNTTDCTKANCSGWTYVKDCWSRGEYCFDSNYLSDKQGRIIQPFNVNTFSSGWLRGSQQVTNYSCDIKSYSAQCRSCGMRLATSREALNVTSNLITLPYSYFNWDSHWDTVTLKNCTTIGVQLSGAEVIIDGGRSPRWTGGLL